MIHKLLPALLLIGTVGLAACGDDDTSSTPSGPNGTDRAFVAEMIPHHESAIEMAEMAQEKGKSAFVMKLADDIVSTQNDEIAVMRREDEGLETAGVKEGSLGMEDHMTGMDQDPAELEGAADFDKEFLQMMIPHHEGAIAMAEVELDKGGDPELRGIAQDIVRAQEREIGEMRKQLGDDAPAESEGAGH